jgi:hypothetical protein
MGRRRFGTAPFASLQLAARIGQDNGTVPERGRAHPGTATETQLSFPAPPAGVAVHMECGGKRSATPLWLKLRESLPN